MFKQKTHPKLIPPFPTPTMSPQKTLILLLPLLLLTRLSTADDAAVMSKLAASLTPPPPGWTGSSFCSWTGVQCDNSNRVTSIDLSSKSLSGTLPSDLSQLSQLKTLALQRNQLSGPLPSFANLSALQELYLDTNQFTIIPKSFLFGLTNLQTLMMSDNPKLGYWEIPAYLADSSKLVTLSASNASISGQIPDFFSSFPSMQNLRLSYNNLTGVLPASLGDSDVRNLWVNNQRLSGSIEVIGRMTQAYQVWLHANEFSGGIPDLSKCKELFDLQLRDNMFTGLVPDSLTGLPKLVNVSLQNNMFQGKLPVFRDGVKVTIKGRNSFCKDVVGDCDEQVNVMLEVAGAIGYPASLAEAWQGNDACGGKWDFVSCDSEGKRVTVVNFGKQGFVGTISPAFGNLSSLRSLLLNDNELSGSIPESLTGLRELMVLDVSNNNLSGKVPSFPPGVKFIRTGNALLGKDIGGASSGSTGGPGAGTSKGGSVSAGLIAGVAIASVVFIVVVVFVCYKCYVKKRIQRFGIVQSPEKGKEGVNNNNVGVGTSNNYGGGTSDLQTQSCGTEMMTVFEGGNVVISIEVLQQVTGNFSEENILGRGGFGVVYKGELHDGTQIAVKRMESGVMGTKGLNEFQAEIGVLTKVRHRHLVALLGYCINGNERLLVYEYMPQGTLSQHLFEYREFGYPPLSWKQRVTIALDVARGIEYLHSLAQQSFIHRDLKPSNILLGDDMRAKVADFGLVKNAPDGKQSVETRLAGTFGYLAPEYAATGRVTTKVDVYAFGVVLMEIVTGRKSLDDTLPDESSHLVAWFRRILINKDNIRNAIDQTLDPDEETFDSICRVAELAGHCTAREPFQRPDMGHAVNVLGPLVEQWKPSHPEEDENYGIDLHMSLPQALQRWQANEGTSTMTGISFSQTQSSIPSKPSGLAHF